MTTTNLKRLLTLISGALAVVLPNIGVFSLPTSTQAIITTIGGAILAILVALEHPTTQTAASTKQAVQTSVTTKVPPSV